MNGWDETKLKKILFTFNTVAAEMGVSVSAVVVGGAALTLQGYRTHASCDIDMHVVNVSVGRLKMIEQTVSERLQLAPGWLNLGVSMFLPNSVKNLAPQFTSAGLRFEIPSPSQLLALKLVADRVKDQTDIRSLLQVADQPYTITGLLDLIFDVYDNDEEFLLMILPSTAPSRDIADVKAEVTELLIQQLQTHLRPR